MEEEKKVRTELTPEELEKASGGTNDDGFVWCRWCAGYVCCFDFVDGRRYCHGCHHPI